MKRVIKLEELLMMVLGLYLFNLLDMSWWWFWGLILLPDIGMLGYAISSKVGAVTYNLFHHKGIAVIVYLMGIYLKNGWLQLVGVILFIHSSMDRILGYGLKYSDSFKNTHLGKIGK